VCHTPLVNGHESCDCSGHEWLVTVKVYEYENEASCNAAGSEGDALFTIPELIDAIAESDEQPLVKNDSRVVVFVLLAHR